MTIVSGRHIQLKFFSKIAEPWPSTQLNVTRPPQEFDSVSLFAFDWLNPRTYKERMGEIRGRFRADFPKFHSFTSGLNCLTPLHRVCYGQHVLIVRCLVHGTSSFQRSVFTATTNEHLAHWLGDDLEPCKQLQERRSAGWSITIQALQMASVRPESGFRKGGNQLRLPGFPGGTAPTSSGCDSVYPAYAMPPLHELPLKG